MGTWGALLHSTDVQRGCPEVHLLPAQVHQFGGPQAMPVGHKDHRGVAVTPTVSLGGIHKPLDLGLRQVLSGPQVSIGWAFGCDCSIYGGWRDQPEVPFGHVLGAPRLTNCSYNSHFLHSQSTDTIRPLR